MLDSLCGQATNEYRYLDEYDGILWIVHLCLNAIGNMTDEEVSTAEDWLK